MKRGTNSEVLLTTTFEDWLVDIHQLRLNVDAVIPRSDIKMPDNRVSRSVGPDAVVPQSVSPSTRMEDLLARIKAATATVNNLSALYEDKRICDNVSFWSGSVSSPLIIPLGKRSTNTSYQRHDFRSKRQERGRY